MPIYNEERERIMKKRISLLIALLIALITFCTCLNGCSEKEYTKGSVTDGVYTNESLGVKFAPSADLFMATEADLLGYMGIENSDDTAIDYSTVASVYEMMAADSNFSSNIVIISEIVDDDLGVKEYIDNLKAAYFESNQNIGSFSDIEERSICSGTYSYISYSIPIGDISSNQAFFIRKIGGHIVSICITYVDDAQVQLYLDCFEEI